MKPEYLKPDDAEFCLKHLVEECGEVLAAAGKTLRWGPSSVNPEIPAEQAETNLAWLLRELDDLSGAIFRFKNAVGSADDAK